jgi:hypothetical protein
MIETTDYDLIGYADGTLNVWAVRDAGPTPRDVLKIGTTLDAESFERAAVEWLRTH